MKKFLIRLFRSKAAVRLEKQLKVYLRAYFEPPQYESGGNRAQYICPVGCLEITNIFVQTNRQGIVLMEITLGKPGLLIGPKGKTIDSLTQYIGSRIPQPLEIIVKESTLWI